MKCNKFDTRTFEAILNDGETSIIHVEKGDVDQAIKIILGEMDRLEHPKKYKMSRSELSYYHYTYHAEVYEDALKENNIKATVWD